uniref:Uncharacterized protein n=1 Tax=Mesocestoides corti TaxID=53468 RepID=A0A5K3FZ27_MESCO
MQQAPSGMCSDPESSIDLDDWDTMSNEDLPNPLEEQMQLTSTLNTSTGVNVAPQEKMQEPEVVSMVERKELNEQTIQQQHSSGHSPSHLTRDYTSRLCRNASILGTVMPHITSTFRANRTIPADPRQINCLY